MRDAATPRDERLLAREVVQVGREMSAVAVMGATRATNNGTGAFQVSWRRRTYLQTSTRRVALLLFGAVDPGRLAAGTLPTRGLSLAAGHG